MAVQTDPPIQIDPDMDKGHQWAFVNQNFRSLSDTLGKQSFNIVLSGTTTNPAGGDGTNITIAHNLGYTPIPLVYTFNSSGSSYTPLPTFTSITTGAATLGWQGLVTTTTDSVNLYIDFILASGVTVLANDFSFKYYLLQIAAN